MLCNMVHIQQFKQWYGFSNAHNQNFKIQNNVHFILFKEQDDFRPISAPIQHHQYHLISLWQLDPVRKSKGTKRN